MEAGLLGELGPAVQELVEVEPGQGGGLARIPGRPTVGGLVLEVHLALFPATDNLVRLQVLL